MHTPFFRLRSAQLLKPISCVGLEFLLFGMASKRVIILQKIYFQFCVLKIKKKLKETVYFFIYVSAK